VLSVDHDSDGVCVETLRDAMARHGELEIFNTEQGSQFAGQAFTGMLADNGVAIRMYGKGAWRDNVFAERLWRSVKYEEDSASLRDRQRRAARSAVISTSTCRRPHSSLDGMAPDQAYFTQLLLRVAA
jgi:putative transposase